MSSQVSVMSSSLAPIVTDSAKSLKKRKKRSKDVYSSMTDAGWAEVNIEDMQLKGFQDGCAFELEELTDYRVETTERDGKILLREKQSLEESRSENKKKRRKLKVMKKQLETENKVDIDAEGTTMTVDEKSIELRDGKREIEENAMKKGKKQKKYEGKMKKKEEQVKMVALSDVTLPKWNKYKLHPLLMQSLQICGFSAPTRIQERTLLPALVDNRDIVGAAPTGSGKTLAFGLPILSQLLHEREQPGYTKDFKALILTPTRELAIQIQQHIEKMVRHREIGVVTLVGGMAVQKQTRILGYRPEIVIGTPGRLWDIIETNNEHMKNMASTLRFLVIDEADRMLQPGSYPELEKIFDVLRRKKNTAAMNVSNVLDTDKEDVKGSGSGDDNDDKGDDENVNMGTFASGIHVMELDDVLKIQHEQQDKEKRSGLTEESKKASRDKAQVGASLRHVRQTFLFSATLTIPEGGRLHKKKTKKYRNAFSVLERVMKRVGLRGKPAVVDVGTAEPEIGFPGAKIIVSEEEQRKMKKQQESVALSLPAGLELCQHEVTESTRDSFLYYFLTQYPGRTIIFLNAILQVRKLTSLLNLLDLPVFALHAEMQQRQRLKKLDSFRAHAKGILVATDVAARGLDIPSVGYVVHYHIACSTEVFMHRSGRTARANKEGLSIALVSPTDAKNHAQICKMLQRSTGLSDFPLDHRYMEAIDERMRLAKIINEQENAAGKLKSEAIWFEQMAAAADLEMDDDLLFELGAKERNEEGKKRATQNQSVQSLRAQLKRLLAVPLRPVGSARKFRQLHKELGVQISSDGEYRTRDASKDLASKGKKTYKRFCRRE